MGLRLMNDWVMIKMDADSNELCSGLLVKPGASFNTILRTGKVINVGPGPLAKKDDNTYIDKRISIDISIGDGVVFNRFIASDTKSAQALHQISLAEDEALIRPSDILLVFDYESRPRFE
jgi:co-chaperonin GroES (HSP10)